MIIFAFLSELTNCLIFNTARSVPISDTISVSAAYKESMRL